MAVKTGTRQREVHGLVHHSLIAGAFYQGLYPGGFSDSLTGIHIPGPRANVDDSNKREIINFIDIPEPVQLPHFKIVLEVSDGGKTRKEVEVDFNANDEQPVHEAFQLALSTGVIRLVADEIMEEKYPETWAMRKEKYVWRDFNTKPQRPVTDLFEEAENAGAYLRIAQNQAKLREVKAQLESKKRQMDEAPDDDKPSVKRPPKIAK
jgi:hypothetical protein